MKALGAFLLASFLLSSPPYAPPASAEGGRVDSEFLEVDGSGVRGEVLLVDLPVGGTLAVVNLEGLTPDASYLVIRAAGGSCDLESYEEEDAILDLTANTSGRATATLELDEETDELGTISVWTPEHALVACATIQ